jgi:predicted NBD/HSP70 family sugar kinase
MSLALGIDVGGTKVLGGVVDSSGKIVKSARFRVDFRV